MTDQYNTELSPEEERAFQAWAAANSRGGDLYDYDLRGFWKTGGHLDASGHATDLFKKPNHPTFSTESKYHGVDNNEGGKWEKKGDQWSFTPSTTNLDAYGPLELQDYFTRVEPGVRLNLPEGR